MSSESITTRSSLQRLASGFYAWLATWSLGGGEDQRQAGLRCCVLACFILLRLPACLPACSLACLIACLLGLCPLLACALVCSYKHTYTHALHTPARRIAVAHKRTGMRVRAHRSAMTQYAKKPESERRSSAQSVSQRPARSQRASRATGVIGLQS